MLFPSSWLGNASLGEEVVHPLRRTPCFPLSLPPSLLYLSSPLLYLSSFLFFFLFFLSRPLSHLLLLLSLSSVPIFFSYSPPSCLPSPPLFFFFQINHFLFHPHLFSLFFFEGIACTVCVEGIACTASIEGIACTVCPL